MKYSYAPRKIEPAAPPGALRPARAALALLAALLMGSGGSGAPGSQPAPPPKPPLPQGPPAAPKAAAGAPRAEPAAEPTPASAAADKLISAVQARYERVRDLRASFVQEASVASMGRKETSSGTVSVKRPGRMRWEYSVPEPRVLTVDAQTVKMYAPSEKQLQVAALDPKTFSPTALSFLLGSGDLRRSFKAELLEASDRKETGLRLRPKSDASFEHLDLWLAAGDLQLRESVVVDLFGNRTSVRFSDVVENSGVAEGAFDIDVPAGTEIIDLR